MENKYKLFTERFYVGERLTKDNFSLNMDKKELLDKTYFTTCDMIADLFASNIVYGKFKDVLQDSYATVAMFDGSKAKNYDEYVSALKDFVVESLKERNDVRFVETEVYSEDYPYAPQAQASASQYARSL